MEADTPPAWLLGQPECGAVGRGRQEQARPAWPVSQSLSRSFRGRERAPWEQAGSCLGSLLRGSVGDKCVPRAPFAGTWPPFQSCPLSRLPAAPRAEG